ncbi:hypothetical protein OIU76_029107, partial [Salix suchowensis]
MKFISSFIMSAKIPVYRQESIGWRPYFSNFNAQIISSLQCVDYFESIMRAINYQ